MTALVYNKLYYNIIGTLFFRFVNIRAWAGGSGVKVITANDVAAFIIV